MPAPTSTSTRSQSRHGVRRAMLLAGGIAMLSHAAVAQTADLGAAVAGGTGMRGTEDATDPGQAAAGYEPEAGNVATLGVPAPPPKPKLRLKKLPNGALPERHPVPLVTLAPYPRAIRPRMADPLQVEAPGPTIAALPVPLRRAIKPDDDPFGPIGYGIGSTRVLPYIEQSLGYDSNPEQIATGVKDSAFSRTEGGLSIQSDWLVHELKGTLRAGYDAFFDNPRADRPDANGVVDLRIDVTRDTKLDAEARFNVDTQMPDSPELNVAVRDRPVVASYGGTFGVTQAFGRFSVGLHGLVDRTEYANGELADGTPVALDYQDVTDIGSKVRLGYDLKPGLQPFVEVGYDRRVHDDTVDPFGYRRDSDGVGARIGSSFEFWPQLTGTASVGYAARSYDDPRLKDLTGPTGSASLIWAATPLTTLTLTASTAFDETTVVGSSGIESRLIGLTISHALFRYLTLIAAASYQQNEYVGIPITEDTFTASLKAEYHLSRSVVLTGTLSHQRLKSTIAGSDYTQNVALVGLRVQH